MSGDTESRPLTPERLPDLADLFETNAVTRGCWCTGFLVPRAEYSRGLRGGNRARFEALARESELPMGVLAYQAGRPVGWVAVGPRSRYKTAIGPRAVILKGRDPAQDDAVWLAPCFFVRTSARKQGLTRRLLQAAVDLAASFGARAIEGFPRAADAPRSTADEYVGREPQFAECGFECIARPTPARTVMRRELTG